MASLPPDTWTYWTCVQRALRSMPADDRRNLRQYQLHQYRNGSFELRTLAEGPLPAGFERRIMAAWEDCLETPAPALRLQAVDEFPRQRKFQNFTSEFMPGYDSRA